MTIATSEGQGDLDIERFMFLRLFAAYLGLFNQRSVFNKKIFLPILNELQKMTNWEMIEWDEKTSSKYYRITLYGECRSKWIEQTRYTGKALERDASIAFLYNCSFLLFSDVRFSFGTIKI